jgi:hypothetical protein
MQMNSLDGTLTSAPVMNDTLLPTVTIDGTFTSTPVINDTLLPTVTIE